jgi:hypothetical protein
MGEDKAFQSSMQKIEELIGTLDRAADPALRSAAKELVSALMEVHGACLARMLDTLNKSGEAGQHAIRTYVEDPLIRNLLILYELHPVEFDVRVKQALEKFQSSKAAADAKVELLSTEGGNIRVRYSSDNKGCGAGGLKASIEAALIDAAPDASGIFVEDASPKISQAFVPLSALGVSPVAEFASAAGRSSDQA